MCKCTPKSQQDGEIWQEGYTPLKVFYPSLFLYNFFSVENMLSGGLLKRVNNTGPAVSIMAMSLDSHVAGHYSSPRPGGLNSRWVCVRVCVCAQDPERRMEEKGLQCGHSP